MPDDLPWEKDPRNEGIILLRVKVIPGASKTQCAGYRTTAEGPALLVRVAAAPEKGKANDELIAWLSEALGLPRSSIELRVGAASRLKRLSLPAAYGEHIAALVP